MARFLWALLSLVLLPLPTGAQDATNDLLLEGNISSTMTDVSSTPSATARTTTDMPSLMFTDEDIRALEQVLVSYRANKKTKTVVADEGPSNEDLLAELLRKSKTDQSETTERLPDFYVSSLAYRNPEDWSVWVVVGNDSQIAAGIKPYIMLNPKKDNNSTQGLRVIAVNKEQVTLGWKAENAAMAYQRFQMREEANKLLKHMQHRRAENEANFDEKENEFVVIMRPNQTFATEVMQLFEGRYQRLAATTQTAEASLDPLAVEPPVGAAPPGATTPAPVPVAAQPNAEPLAQSDNLEQFEELFPTTE